MGDIVPLSPLVKQKAGNCGASPSEQLRMGKARRLRVRLANIKREKTKPVTRRNGIEIATLEQQKSKVIAILRQKNSKAIATLGQQKRKAIAAVDLLNNAKNGNAPILFAKILFYLLYC